MVGVSLYMNLKMIRETITSEVWSVAPTKSLFKLQKNRGFWDGADFSYDGRRLASLESVEQKQAGTTFSTKVIRMREVETGKHLATLAIPSRVANIMGSNNHVIESVAFSPDGQSIEALDVEGGVCIYKIVLPESVDTFLSKRK